MICEVHYIICCNRLKHSTYHITPRQLPHLIIGPATAIVNLNNCLLKTLMQFHKLLVTCQLDNYLTVKIPNKTNDVHAAVSTGLKNHNVWLCAWRCQWIRLSVHSRTLEVFGKWAFSLLSGHNSLPSRGSLGLASLSTTPDRIYFS